MKFEVFYDGDMNQSITKRPLPSAVWNDDEGKWEIELNDLQDLRKLDGRTFTVHLSKVRAEHYLILRD